jgi:hypothetical protein
VSHSTCTHQGQVDSRLLVVRSQTASLTLSPSFNHNLCYKCSNGSCKAISDIYTSRPFQWYKEHINARCFDPCNRVLNFQESQRTPKSHFRECEWRPHTSLKVGLRHTVGKLSRMSVNSLPLDYPSMLHQVCPLIYKWKCLLIFLSQTTSPCPISFVL